MGKTVEALRYLQAVERKLGELRKQEAEKRRQLQAHKRQTQKCADALASQTDAMRHHEAEIRNIELEIGSREELVQRHRVALNKAKTNKEYAAILTTINTEKADTSKLESRVLEIMHAKEGLQKSFDDLAAEKSKLEQRGAQLQARLDTFLEQNRAELERLVSERERAGAALPPTIVSTFDRAAERHDGEAIAAIVKVNPKRDEFVCGGCNMGITLETVVLVRSRDEVVVCNQCGRILCPED